MTESLAALASILVAVALMSIGVSRALDALGEFTRDPR